MCNLSKTILTCPSSANRAWAQFLSCPGNRGTGCRPGELDRWWQHPTPHFLSAGLESCFPVQKGHSWPEHSAPSPRATGPGLITASGNHFLRKRPWRLLNPTVNSSCPQVPHPNMEGSCPALTSFAAVPTHCEKIKSLREFGR